ncbi:hypothetical protein BU17DRAFT_90585 [Hysterangium stoloniferum]|nr:hypothetical protein BU17DRAFT_90585 [Hysterangium stoloniferum]
MVSLQASGQQARVVVVSSYLFISGSQDEHLRIWVSPAARTQVLTTSQDLPTPPASTIHTLQASHTSGAFAQYDLQLNQCDRDSKPSSPLLYKPLDVAHRAAMTWTPKNDVAFVGDSRRRQSAFGRLTFAKSTQRERPRKAQVAQQESGKLWLDSYMSNRRQSSSLRLSKEDTTVVGTLPLLDNDATHGHLQSSLHSSPHASPRFARIHLSAHLDPSSPRLTPSPSPRANPIVLPFEPQILPVSVYDASTSSAGICPFLPYTGGGALDDSDSESRSDSNDDDHVNGGESVGKAIPVDDRRGRIKIGETRRISSLFMESSLPKRLTSSFTTDTHSSTSLTNPHASSSFSPSHHLIRPAHPYRNQPLPFALQPGDAQGPTKPQSALESIVQLREGSPDSRLASDERSNREHDDDEDEHGDSNTHSGSDTKSGSG